MAKTNRLTMQAGDLTPKSQRAQRKIERLLLPIYRRLASTAADEAERLLTPEKLAALDSALTKGEKAESIADEIMRALETELGAIAKGVEKPLADSALEGLKQAKLQISIDNQAAMIAKANKAATAFAEKRAAEMVGMKWVDGELVENPNAEWAISDTMRDELRDIIEEAFSKETAPIEEIKEAIKEAGCFSEYRARMVARSEVSLSQIAGNMSVWKATGMVQSYDWFTSENDNVCDECRAIAANGPYTFGSGPVPVRDTHPNCDCIIAANLEEEAEAAAIESNLLKAKEPLAMNDKNKKANPSEGRVYLEIPITKFDEEQRIVEGVATAEVLDSQNDIVDFPAAKIAFGSWEGNIREQHDPKKAVGHAIEWKPEDDTKSIRLTAHISKGAQDTWEKVKDGTLRYFSIGSPYGGYERKAETIKSDDGSEKKANRLILKTLSEVSLVDKGACPNAIIELVKADGAFCPSLIEEEQPPAGDPAPAAAAVEADKSAAPAVAADDAVEKITEGASDYADPGWQEDKKKRYPLDTEAHVRSAASYFGRPKNRKKYTPEQQKKIDAKIEVAKKKFKIGEYADKAAAEYSVLNKDGNEVPWEWRVSMSQPDPSGEMIQSAMWEYPRYIPRTFGAVYEDVEEIEVFPLMTEVLGRMLCNVMCSRDLSGQEKLDLIQQNFDEFIEEIEEELTEDEELTEEEKAAKSDLQKRGARNSKADMRRIQGMHDDAVALGAVCKGSKTESKETDEEKAVKSLQGVLKACGELSEAVKLYAGVFKSLQDCGAGPVVLSKENFEQLVAGTPLEKVQEIAKAAADELQKAVSAQLESKAEKSDVAQVSEITSKNAGDIQKQVGQIKSLQDNVEKLNKEPMPMPIISEQIVSKFLAGAGDIPATGDSLSDTIATLEKMQAETPDALLKQSLGMKIGELKVKRGRTQGR